MSRSPETMPPEDDRPAFVAVMAGTAFLALVALGLSFLLGTPLGPQLALNANDALIGVIATLPPVLFLWLFSRATQPALVSFRNSQIEFFANIGFVFTPARIAVMAFGAGLSEELLFRGVLQTWLAGFLPVAAAIVVSNAVFGLLHMRTVLYAVVAGLVGAYLGLIYLVTDNLLTPMITHMLYDVVALEYTRRAVAAYRAGNRTRTR